MSSSMGGANLEARLVDLGAHVEYPPVPALTTAIRERIEGSVDSRRVAWWRRPALLAAAACVLLAAVLVTAVPTTRRAVADFLGIDGIRISFDPPPDEPLGTRLALGTRATMQQAQSFVGFDLKVPRELGEPNDVYLDRYAPNGAVSFVYDPAAGLPETQETGVGAVFTQFEGDDDIVAAKKKFVESDVEVIPVTVDGVQGYWIDGAHGFYPTRAAARLAGKTLLWQIGAISYRLELDTSLDRAIEIAESLE